MSLKLIFYLYNCGQRIMTVEGYLLMLIGGHFRRSSSTSKSKGSFVSITESSELVFETISLQIMYLSHDRRSEDQQGYGWLSRPTQTTARLRWSEGPSMTSSSKNPSRKMSLQACKKSVKWRIKILKFQLRCLK